MTPDPIGLLGGINLYVYAGLNPINLIDPLGLEQAYPWGKGFLMSITETLGGTGFAALHAIEKHNKHIVLSAQKYKIDPNLIKAIIYEEYSHQFPPYIEDKVGGATIGLGQFTEERWQEFGEGCQENRNDPEKSIYAMANYINFLMRVYGNDISKIGTGYNYYEPGKTIPQSSKQYGERIKIYYNWFKQQN